MYQTTDTETGLVGRLEALTIPAGEFTHAAHVEAAWLYLTDPTRGAEAFRRALLRFVDHHGARDKYHETLTVAYLELIASRLRVNESWRDFVARNQDLLERADELLALHYSPECLASDKAKAEFVAPDRRELPTPRGDD